MSRGRKKAILSIPDLERMLEERRSSLTLLQKKRDELMAKVDEIDQQIAAEGGSVKTMATATAKTPAARGRRGRTAGGRVRNEASLGDTIASVMEGNGPMGVSDILNAVVATGYRSGSANFRGIVNQTLIKDQRFQQASRGHYAMG